MYNEALISVNENIHKTRTKMQNAHEEGNKTRATNLSRALTSLKQAKEALERARAFEAEDQAMLDAACNGHN